MNHICDKKPGQEQCQYKLASSANVSVVQYFLYFGNRYFWFRTIVYRMNHYFIDVWSIMLRKQ